MKNRRLRLLHITTWYPSELNPYEGVFVERHIKALEPFVSQNTVHLQVKPDSQFKVVRTSLSNGFQMVLSIPIRSWFVIEVITAVLLVYFLIRFKVNSKYDIINFHVAYPLLTYWHAIKRFIKPPILITEHWSAYHFSFNSSKSLHRIKNIFRQRIPVVTVSNALSCDIEIFSDASFPCFVVPNVVDHRIFYEDQNIPRENMLFMVSNWNRPKTPFVVMKAFLEVNRNESGQVLVIDGEGNLWDEMKDWVKREQAEGQVKLIGQLTSIEIASYMRRCRSFIHPSEYETFSIVCAEALCCGTPVIASEVGGVKEIVSNHGTLVRENNLDGWINALKNTKDTPFNPSSKAEIFNNQFSLQAVGKKYFEVISELTHAQS